jgi:hypothetical protein
MQDWTLDAVERVTESILRVLGDPLESHQAEALTAFKAGDYATVRRVAAVHLGDSFSRSLAYLGSAYKLTPNTDTIVAEACRAAADHARDLTLQSLGRLVASTLGSQPLSVVGG